MAGEAKPNSYLAVYCSQSGERMSWPNPRDPMGVQYRLRYGPPSRRDHVVAAVIYHEQTVEVVPKIEAEQRLAERDSLRSQIEAEVEYLTKPGDPVLRAVARRLQAIRLQAILDSTSPAQGGRGTGKGGSPPKVSEGSAERKGRT